jgi:hypothetical protein
LSFLNGPGKPALGLMLMRRRPALPGIRRVPPDCDVRIHLPGRVVNATDGHGRPLVISVTNDDTILTVNASRSTVVRIAGQF